MAAIETCRKHLFWHIFTPVIHTGSVTLLKMYVVCVVNLKTHDNGLPNSVMSGEYVRV